VHEPIPIESQGPCHHGLQHFCLYPADAHGEEQTPLGLYRELIGDIALKCGFEDANYFARLFKQIFNVTPSQYRKSLIQ